MSTTNFDGMTAETLAAMGPIAFEHAYLDWEKLPFATNAAERALHRMMVGEFSRRATAERAATIRSNTRNAKRSWVA